MREATPDGGIRPEDFFGRLFDTLGDAVMIADVRTRHILLWNPAATTIFGYTAEEAKDMPLTQLTPPELIQREEAGIEAFSGGHRGTIVGANTPVEMEALRKDGTRILIELSLTKLDGTLMLAIARDVTLRRHVEQDLDRLFSLSPDLICIANFDGYFLRLNPAWERVLGYTRDELTARPFIDFVHADDVKATNEQMAALREGADTIAFENRYRCSDGTYRWMQWNATPSQRRGVVFAIARDVTEEHAFREELQNLAVERQRMIDQLKQLDNAKSRFVADAAHELRQPLATLAGFAHLLGTRRDKMTPEQVESSFRAIETQTDHINSLVANLLDLSNLEREEPDLTMEPVTIALAAQRALQVAPPPAGYTVTVEVPDNIRVRADVHRLDQVLINLLTNAYRYGGKQIEISGSAHNSTATFTVADDGPGIAADFVPRVFDPFTRRGNGRERGAGLGLAIVKRIVEGCGGRIRYSDNDPHGARFEIVLPAVR